MNLPFKVVRYSTYNFISQLLTLSASYSGQVVFALRHNAQSCEALVESGTAQKWCRNTGCFASYPVVCVSLHEQGTVDTQSGLAAQSDPIAVYLRLCQYINRCVPVKPVLIIFWHYPNPKNAGGLHDWRCPIRVTRSQNYGKEQVNCTGAFRWKCIFEKHQMQNPAWHRMQSVGLQTWWFSQKMFCTVANVLKNKERICMLCSAVLPNHSRSDDEVQWNPKLCHLIRHIDSQQLWKVNRIRDARVLATE